MDLNLQNATMLALQEFTKQSTTDSQKFSDLLCSYCCKLVLEQYNEPLQNMSGEGINKLSNKIYLEMMRLSMEIDKMIYMSAKGYD